MKKIFWLLVCVLALLVVGLAGCGGEDSNGKDPVDPALLTELKITEADVARTLKSLQYANEQAVEAQAMAVLARDRAMLLAAERRSLLPDREEVRQRVAQNYELMRENAAEPQENVHGAAEAWEFLQGYLAHMEMTEEEYLAMAGDTLWAAEAGQAVRADFTEDLTPEQQADEWEVLVAWSLRQDELVAEYGRLLLVDEALRPLLDEYLASVQEEIEVLANPSTEKPQ